MKTNLIEKLTNLFESREELIDKKHSIETDIEMIDCAIDSVIKELKGSKIEVTIEEANIDEVIDEVNRHMDYMRKIFNK